VHPEIRYVDSPDGTRIAYSVVGRGPALVIMPVMPGTHLTLDWQLPHRAEWYGRLAESFTVVRYDGRGAGLSQREVQDLSIDAHVADLRVIVDKLAFDQLALLSRHISAPVAIRFAVENPERVSRLVLWNAVYRFEDFTSTRRQQALNLLLEHDFELFTETVAYAGQGWPETHRARQFAEYMRASISQTMYSDYLRAFRDVDVSSLLPRVSCPALVFHRRDVTKFDLGVSQKLAAGLGNARLVVADGSSSALFGEDLANITDTIESFLKEACDQADSALNSAKLTVREREVLRLLAAGKSNRDIAALLGVSVHTVDRHLANIFGKIGAHNRLEAALFAVSHGLLASAST
jgi:DNA-binding CsgD family transcriptional regulator/pimeloyl-ACP methyl ester carboxylesterase